MLDLHPNIHKLLGYTQKEYNGGEKYISEGCHKLNVSQLISITLNKQINTYNSFYEFHVPGWTFAEMVSTKGPKFTFKQPISIDDFTITLNTKLDWKCTFEFTCLEIILFTPFKILVNLYLFNTYKCRRVLVTCYRKCPSQIITLSRYNIYRHL
ncbi:hypothetical protein SAGO17_0065 [Mimivirus AB-566-O17]|uniref:Uncharacterized protein n=1 Tax=Mimivirus AB-566-O17 TaxID=1988039 RepID=A0A1X9VNS4_9VIRU|nr:hypothetical protein SAGO17_0065 [Mimivirus AB-566-O17]